MENVPILVFGLVFGVCIAAFVIRILGMNEK